MLGRSVARKSDPEEDFSDKERRRNRSQFKELENLLKLKSPNRKFRSELVDLIGDCRGFDSLWQEAPRLKLVHAELKGLQTAFRRRPEKLQEYLSNLSEEATYRLNLIRQTEDTPPNEMQKVIQAAIKDTPKDKGGVSAHEEMRFFVGNFAQLIEKRTTFGPTLTYSAYNEQHSGVFLECLELVSAMIWGTEANRESLADVTKLLFYKKK